jgi:hypothetical protein
MKKIFKCEFKYTNLNTRVWVSTFFYLEGDDKFSIERIAIIKSTNELKGKITDYELTYYRVEETTESKNR